MFVSTSLQGVLVSHFKLWQRWSLLVLPLKPDSVVTTEIVSILEAGSEKFFFFFNKMVTSTEQGHPKVFTLKSSFETVHICQAGLHFEILCVRFHISVL